MCWDELSQKMQMLSISDENDVYIPKQIICYFPNRVINAYLTAICEGPLILRAAF
jgi:hypothetical protein